MMAEDERNDSGTTPALILFVIIMQDYPDQWTLPTLGSLSQSRRRRPRVVHLILDVKKRGATARHATSHVTPHAARRARQVALAGGQSL